MQLLFLVELLGQVTLRRITYIKHRIINVMKSFS